MDTKIPLTENETITIDGTAYSIDAATASALKEGVIPTALQEQIKQRQGDDVCFEFCRQRRLMKKICDQIDAGELPETIRPLIESASVPAEILYKLYHKKLHAKADRLHKDHLITDEVLAVISKDILTAEIIAPLEHAFFVDIARYLYEHHEISREILEGVKQGSIDIKYIKVIRRYYRQMLSLSEVEQNHLASRDGVDLERLETLDAFTDGTEMEKGLVQELNQSYLKEAMAWLPPEDAKLIHQIYFDRIPLTEIAKQIGVTEGTIRYHRTRILSKLKLILEDVMKLSRDILL